MYTHLSLLAVHLSIFPSSNGRAFHGSAAFLRRPGSNHSPPYLHSRAELLSGDADLSYAIPSYYDSVVQDVGSIVISNCE